MLFSVSHSITRPADHRWHGHAHGSLLRCPLPTRVLSTLSPSQRLAPVVQFVAPALAVSYAAPAPVIECSSLYRISKISQEHEHSYIWKRRRKRSHASGASALPTSDRVITRDHLQKTVTSTSWQASHFRLAEQSWWLIFPTWRRKYSTIRLQLCLPARHSQHRRSISGRVVEVRV